MEWDWKAQLQPPAFDEAWSKTCLEGDTQERWHQMCMSWCRQKPCQSSPMLVDTVTQVQIVFEARA